MFRFFKSIIRQHPFLYFTLVGQSPAVKRLRAKRDSELVIEGFPRSANTTSVLALFHAQGESLRVGHHLHVPAHIKYAVKNEIPCLVVMRNPLDCVASLMVMRKGGKPANYLKDYIDFARVVEQLKQRIVVVDFNDIVKSGIGPGIATVNRKFGTSFKLPSGSDQERLWIEKRVREINRAYSAGDPESLSIPSASKHENAALMKEKIRTEGATELRKAELLYGRLTQPTEAGR